MHALGQLPFPLVGIELHQPFGGQEVQNPVAEEFQPFVVVDLAGALPGAGMGQGPVQQVAVGEAVAEALLERGDGRLAPVLGGSSAHFSRWKKRLGRASVNQVQGLKIEAWSFHDKRIRSALPSRFSNGT